MTYKSPEQGEALERIMNGSDSVLAVGDRGIDQRLALLFFHVSFALLHARDW